MWADGMLRRTLSWAAGGMLVASLATPAVAQERGKAELKTESGAITIDYGRPSLKGRDMLGQLEDGAFWRMGMNQATVLETPVALTFGETEVAKGSYSLWLKKQADTFFLVFNSQTGQWGTQHDPAKDVYSVELMPESLTEPVEVFTIELKGDGQPATLDLSWADTKLTSVFTFGQ
jgi:hypothetical protein